MNEVDKQEEASSEGEVGHARWHNSLPWERGQRPELPAVSPGHSVLGLVIHGPGEGSEYVGLRSEASLPWVARTLSSVSQALHALGSWRLAFRGL